MGGDARIMVCGSFTAIHSCVEGHPHQHEWHVTAWFNAPVRADARLHRAALDTMLARLEGTTLPVGADWNEDIAKQIGLLCSCVKVRVWRQADRLGCEWRPPCSTASS